MIIPRTIIEGIDKPQKTLPEEREFIRLLNDKIRSITLNYGTKINNGKTIIEKQEIIEDGGNIYPINSTEFYDGEIYIFENEMFYCCYFVRYSNTGNESVDDGYKNIDKGKPGSGCGNKPEKNRKPISERFEVYYKEKTMNSNDPTWRLVYKVHVVNKQPIIYQYLPNGGWRSKISRICKRPKELF